MLKRIWAFGGIQAQIFRAYLAYAVRSRFVDVDERDRLMAEAHLRAALKMIVSMSYLRGAAMKLGQAMASLPDILPDQIVSTLERLHFEAPPMHFALLREHIRNELGRGPEDAFAEFDPHAFAAASIGQVHRARLVTGETLAVKVQYPGIGRAIRTDFRSISALLLPLHLSKGWNRIKAQVEDVRKVIDMETDYVREAEMLGRARSLFAEDDSIVVPRVYPELSTRRVLSMQFLEGRHVQDFLAPGRTQEERDHFGRLIYLAQSRLHYAGKMLYSDPSPGNFLFLPDGRLGFIDFGCVRSYNDAEWNLNRLADLVLQDGPNTPVRYIRDFAGLAEGEDAPPEHLELLKCWCRWMWRPYWHAGPFDFGDEKYLREGVDLISRFYGERFSLGVPMAVFTTRWYFGTVTMLYRLRARVDVQQIYVNERPATGWPERPNGAQKNNLPKLAT
jgi:predicted unusual protein kinase regulating ubiquinone biosynthesis (AarF/ABC1/UbiB family)